MTIGIKPTIVFKGDSITSSPAIGYQWYKDDYIIAGATKQVYKPTANANYKVMAINNSCQTISDNLLVLVRDGNGNVITDVSEGAAKEINLKIRSTDYIENLIKGNSFFIQFSSVQNKNISLDIINSMGDRVGHKENLINQRTPQKIDIESLSTGIYYVKIYANNKVYVQRVLITNN